MSFESLAEKALELDADRAILVDRWKGGPGKIEFFRLKEGLKLVPPLIYLKGVKLRREFETEIRRVQAVAIAASSDKDIELQKLADALSDFLQLPKKDVQTLKQTQKAKRKTALYVSRGKDGQIQLTFMLVPAWVEAGPRMRLSHLIWDVEKA